VWTADEPVALCFAFSLVAQREDNGADVSKDDLRDSIKADFNGRTPESRQPGDLKSRWTERTTVSRQTHFVRKIAPGVQRFAHFFKVVSETKQLTWRLTEEHLMRAAAGLLSGVSAYHAVRQDACGEDERERQGKARAERNGHVASCGFLPLWRVLQDIEKLSGAAADADAVAERFRGFGGKREGAAGTEGDDKDGGDKRSSGKCPARQQRPAMGGKAAKRMHDSKEDMQQTALVLVAELVRSRKTMVETVSQASKRMQLDSKRGAAEFFILAENKDTDEARTFFVAMPKDIFNIDMSAINATAAAAVARGAVAVRSA